VWLLKENSKPYVTYVLRFSVFEISKQSNGAKHQQVKEAQRDHPVIWLVKWISLGVNQEFRWVAVGTDPAVLAWYRVSCSTSLVRDKQTCPCHWQTSVLSASKQHSWEPQDISVLVSPWHCCNHRNIRVYVTGHVLPYLCTALNNAAGRVKNRPRY
jgi:hypothetical protein